MLTYLRKIKYFLGASAFLFTPFAYSATDKHDCNESLTQVYTAKQKIELISKFVASELSPELVSYLAAPETKVKNNSPLNSTEATLILKDILNLAGQSKPTQSKNYKRRIHERITNEYWKRIAAKKLLVALQKNGILAEPGIIDSLRLKVLLLPTQMVVGKEVLFATVSNALAAASNVLPILPPKIDPIDLPPLSPEVLELLANNHLKSAQHLAVVLMKPWGVASAVTLKGRGPWALGLLILVIQFWDENKKVLKTAAGTVILILNGDDELTKYERETYDSEQVVEELLQEWIAAQPQPVEPGKVDEMRSLFQKQESEGIFR